MAKFVKRLFFPEYYTIKINFEKFGYTAFKKYKRRLLFKDKLVFEYCAKKSKKK